MVGIVIHQDRERAGSFGDDAERYERTRPGYPAELLDDLVTTIPCEAVDVGCGTGIVARLLAERGCDVVGVEPDPRMALVATRLGTAVEVSTFEDWDDRGRRFDVLTSGQAWHWVSPQAGERKAAEVLRPGGRFGVFWNRPDHSREVVEGFRAIYSKLAPHLLDESVVLGTVRPPDEPEASLFASSGSFVDVESTSYRWHRSYTTASWLDELPTHSDHRLLPPVVLDAVLEEVGRFLESLGGELVVDHVTDALLGTRR